MIGLSVSLSVQAVCPAGLSSEGLVEGLFQDRSVRIQKIMTSLHNSQTRDLLERLRKAA